MSIPRADHDACGGYHEHTGECSVHWRDIMSTLGVYNDECEGYDYTGDVQYTVVSIQISMFYQRPPPHYS